jgi:AcrR family transcriptional regulator
MSKPTYKEREKRRREQEILIEARRLIRDSGYVDLNMDMLADAVGISKPTLYQHFKSKEDLVAHLVIEGMEEVEADLRASTESSPLERLKLMLRTMLFSHYKVGGMLAGFGSDLISTTLRTNEAVIAVKRRIAEQINELVEAGKTEGEILLDLPTPMISGLMFSLIGLPATTKKLMSLDNVCQLLPDELETKTAQVLEIFCRAIATHYCI